MESDVASARGREVPAAARDHLSLHRIDYVDHHVLLTSAPRRWAALAWARAMFEDSRTPMARARALGLLGVLLSAPQPPGRVAGWTVEIDEPTRVRMGSRTEHVRDQLAVVTGEETVHLVTGVEYLDGLGARTWPLTACCTAGSLPACSDSLRHPSTAAPPQSENALHRGSHRQSDRSQRRAERA